MNQFKFFISFLFFTYMYPIHADTGHDLLLNCEAVGSQTKAALEQQKLDELRAETKSYDMHQDTIRELNKLVENGTSLRASKCLSFLAGFGGADSLSPLTSKGRRMFCIPKEVSLNQAASLTVEWMKNNKRKLDHGAHTVLAMSNIVNFPCTQNQYNK